MNRTNTVLMPLHREDQNLLLLLISSLLKPISNQITERERGFVLERRCSETFKGVLKGGTIESDDDVQDDAQICTSMLFIFIIVIFSLDF